MFLALEREAVPRKYGVDDQPGWLLSAVYADDDYWFCMDCRVAVPDRPGPLMTIFVASLDGLLEMLEAVEELIELKLCLPGARTANRASTSIGVQQLRVRALDASRGGARHGAWIRGFDGSEHMLHMPDIDTARALCLTRVVTVRVRATVLREGSR